VLTPAVLEVLRERLTSPPEDGGLWTGRQVAAGMAAELGLASVAEPRGWEALRALGWTLQTPRPRPARAASPEEQADYKTSSPRWSPTRRSALPAPGSRPVPPTSPALG
jgi:transposase